MLKFVISALTIAGFLNNLQAMESAAPMALTAQPTAVAFEALPQDIISQRVKKWRERLFAALATRQSKDSCYILVDRARPFPLITAGLDSYLSTIQHSPRDAEQAQQNMASAQQDRSAMRDAERMIRFVLTQPPFHKNSATQALEASRRDNDINFVKFLINTVPAITTMAYADGTTDEMAELVFSVGAQLGTLAHYYMQQRVPNAYKYIIGNFSSDRVRLLVKYGFDVAVDLAHAQNILAHAFLSGPNPLTLEYAAALGDRRALEQALKQLASPAETSSNDLEAALSQQAFAEKFSNALAYAAGQGHEEIVDRLLALGAPSAEALTALTGILRRQQQVGEHNAYQLKHRIDSALQKGVQWAEPSNEISAERLQRYYRILERLRQFNLSSLRADIPGDHNFLESFKGTALEAYRSALTNENLRWYIPTLLNRILEECYEPFEGQGKLYDGKPMYCRLDKAKVNNLLSKVESDDVLLLRTVLYHALKIEQEDLVRLLLTHPEFGAFYRQEVANLR